MTREEFQTERTRIISEMLDNPDEYGIYPTTKCFEQLDALFDSLSLPPAEGAELKDDKPCNKCTYNGHTTICEQCNDGNDYEHFTYNDPYSKESMNFFKVFIKARKDLCAISPAETYSLEEAIRKAFDGFFPQPTAEGAEEFLKLPQNHGKLKYCPAHFLPILIRLIEGFATLHAQRIAEKMKEANQFILDIAGVLGIETDGVGFDGLTLSIDDFKEAADKMVSEIKDEKQELKSRLWDGRHYLMGVEPKNLTVEDALDAFGFGKNGLKI